MGIDKYVPVPGDGTNLILDTNEDGIPDTTETVTMNNVTYGYTKVNVNGAVYHYYVNTNVNAAPKWYVQISNDTNKYVYDTTDKVYKVAATN